MDMIADLRSTGDDIDQFFCTVARMRGHEPHPEIARKIPDRFQKLRKAQIVLQILPIGVDIGAEKGDLDKALSDQVFCLGYNIRRQSSPLKSADKRNDAVGAEVVAAVHDRKTRPDAVLTNGRKPFGDYAVAFGNIKDPAALFPFRHEHLMNDLRKGMNHMSAENHIDPRKACLLYTSDAADEL